jgi:hypothetical protein
MSRDVALFNCGWARLCVVVAAAGCLTLTSTLPLAAQGMEVPGTFEVSTTGAATYTTAIAVPPGSGGMAPVLTLSYSSQGSNGLLGVGWQLDGVWGVGRCPRTVAQDGVQGGVSFNADDRFCLNGQRLVAVTGAYGADGTEYRTEIEQFSKIISRGTAGTGPAWFQVWTKADRVITFGNSLDSRLLASDGATARAWMVTTVSDRTGNSFSVSYVNEPAQAYPTRIDYTANAGAGIAPYNSVQFVYEARPDPVPSYHGGPSLKTTVRLAKVQTFADATLVSDYRLTYAQGSATGRSQLASVTLCTASGTCLPATSFSWQHGNEATGGALSFTQSPSNSLFPGSWSRASFTVGDWNGDGLSDLMFYDGSGRNGFFYMNNGSGFVAGPTINFPAVKNNCVCVAAVSVGDWNGDGLSDLMFQVSFSGSNSINTTYFQPIFYTNNGFSGGALSFTQSPSNSIFPASWSRSSFAVGDWNGDGLSDLMFYDGSGRNGFFYMNNGSGFVAGPTINFPAVRNGCVCVAAVSVGDWNGDGLSDLMFQVSFSSTAINTTYFQPIFYTNNGFSGGALSFTQSPSNSIFPASWSRSSFAVGDWNGDGLSDLVFYDGSGRNGFFYMNNGSGFVAGPTINFPAVKNNCLCGAAVAVGDWTAKGLSDLMFQVYFSGTNPINTTYFQPTFYSSNHLVADVVSRMTTGLGSTTTALYKPLTTVGVHTKDSDAVPPLRDVVGPQWVVSRAERSDGIGGTRAWSYAYAGAKVDQQGRGLLGFRQRTVQDLDTNIIETIDYRQAFPLTGWITGRTRTLNGATLSSEVRTLGATPLGGTRHFVNVQQNVVTGADLDGTPLPTLTTDYQYDAWGNATEVTLSASDGHSRTTSSVFINDEVSWLLGRLTRATVTGTAP